MAMSGAVWVNQSAPSVAEFGRLKSSLQFNEYDPPGEPCVALWLGLLNANELSIGTCALAAEVSAQSARKAAVFMGTFVVGGLSCARESSHTPNPRLPPNPPMR
jgi:hypothetical protein